MIIDIRNYPSDFVPFALGSLLVSQPTPFAKFTVPQLANPGTFVWDKTVTLEPTEPRFAGKVIALVDEDSESQSEYTAMALQAAPNTVTVGSQTSGADGNVSPIVLPGGLNTAYQRRRSVLSRRTTDSEDRCSLRCEGRTDNRRDQGGKG